MPANSPPARSVTGLACDVLAWAEFRAPADQIPSLRRSPGQLAGAAVPSSLLRHSDEQTVVGLAAVLRAIDEGGLEPDGFDNWAVVAAPRYPGRTMFFKTAFPQFAAEGAWGVSPHLISDHSLHSTSGAISQALRAHGPNLGVGGAPGGELEAFVLAAMMLEQKTAPAVWVVMTGWNALRVGDTVEMGSGEFFGCAVGLTLPGRDACPEHLRVLPETLYLEQADTSKTARPRLADWLLANDGSARMRAGPQLDVASASASQLTWRRTIARDKS